MQLQFGLEELPNELIELYKETNGIYEMLDGEKIGELIWTVERVIEENRTYREHQDFKELARYSQFEPFLSAKAIK